MQAGLSHKKQKQNTQYLHACNLVVKAVITKETTAWPRLLRRFPEAYTNTYVLILYKNSIDKIKINIYIYLYIYTFVLIKEIKFIIMRIFLNKIIQTNEF